jgi:hypothetical protein
MNHADKTLGYIDTMNAIDIYLNELRETWGYETEELNDIREKMEELANSCFWEGYNERSGESENIVEDCFPTCGFYAKKSDMDGYE